MSVPSNPLNNVKASKDAGDDQVIDLDFEYLNPKEGFVLEIVYETKKGEKGGRTIIGDIIDGQEAININPPDYVSPVTYYWNTVTSIVFILLGWGAFVSGMFGMFLDSEETGNSIKLIVIGALFLLPYGAITFFEYRNKMTMYIPPKLKEWFDMDLIYARETLDENEDVPEKEEIKPS